MCVYSQLRASRATAAQSGGAWAAPTGRTAAGKSDPIGKQSRVVGQYTKPRCSCRGTAHITVFYVSATNVLPWYGLHLQVAPTCFDLGPYPGLRSRTADRHSRHLWPEIMLSIAHALLTVHLIHSRNKRLLLLPVVLALLDGLQAATTITGGACPVGLQVLSQYPSPACRWWGVGHQKFVFYTCVYV